MLEFFLTIQEQTVVFGVPIPVGAGEANEGANVGGEAEVFRDKTGAILNFRTLRGINGIDVTPAGDVLDIDAQAALDAHRTLLHLIHFLDDGPGDGFGNPVEKTIIGGLFFTSTEWRRSDTTLLFEKLVERSAGGATKLKPTPIVYRLFAANGTTVVKTATDVITYGGILETKRVRTIT